MSESEQDAVILRVVKEAREARQELGPLQVKASILSEDLEAVARFLRAASCFSISTGGTLSFDTPLEMRSCAEFLVPSLDRLPTGPEIRDLSDKLQAAIERNSHLEQRKKELGI